MKRAPDMNRAARMAYRVLAAKKVDSLPVQPLPLLQACRDTQIFTCHQAAELAGIPASEMARLLRDVDAMTFRCGQDRKRYIVVYNPDGNPARLRFTLAHELGHRLLDGGEAEADCFAGHLLCPEPALARMHAVCGELPPEQIAAACYVTLTCARRAAARKPAVLERQLLCEVDELLKASVEKICGKRRPQKDE